VSSHDGPLARGFAPASDPLALSRVARHPRAVRDLPSGTVTFLFTDIEGSTRLLHELGDRYPVVLAEHHRAMRLAFARHGGVEVDTQGDAFFAAFDNASGAVAAAAEAQSALTEGPVRVRMGIHTGEPIVWAEGYAGLDVHRGARICACAHGGQVVLSERTRAELSDVAVRDLGLHRLKDLSEPQQLYQLGDADFPPLRTLHATNLPVQPSPLIGRERELGEVSALLREHRLATLTGPGGSGKTRLALQVAADVGEEFPHGVFWVPLQAVRDPALVVPTIAQTLGAASNLADYLGEKRILLLLDNLEQVIEAAGALSELVAATAHTRLLVTSREPLRIAGEQRYEVEPLPELDAVTLFVERARGIDHSFAPDEHVAEICRRLDGLPLALELAAARVGLLSTRQLIDRLDRALPVLTHGARELPERQRTLRATIAWSHDLLDEEEQRLFRRLAVFAASFDLEAVEPVSGATLDTLQSLVDKSLVRRWGSGRLGMLETIHEYASERLTASAEADDVARRHVEHYLAVATSANVSGDAEGEQRHDVAALEQENFRTALAWTIARGETGLGLELAVAIGGFWAARDPFEGVRWLEPLLEHADRVDPLLRAHALREYGGLVFLGGSFERGLQLQEQALAEYRSLGDERGVAESLGRLAVASEVIPDRHDRRKLAQEALRLNRRLGRQRGEAQALHALATLEWETDDKENAAELMERSAALARASGFVWWELHCVYLRCEWALEGGDSAAAERLAREAHDHTRRIGDRRVAVYLLAILARLEAEAGRLERAGLLWGAIEAEETRGPVGQWEAERDTYAGPVLAHAGGEFDVGREAGRGMRLDEAIERALAGSGTTEEASAASAP
jgi:predicted ATPase/class 3 adenylate cyclase